MNSFDPRKMMMVSKAACPAPGSAMAAQLAGSGSMAVGPAPPYSATPYQRYREMTIDELLLENRVIFLVGEIHSGSANHVVMRLLHLQNQKKEMDINLYINSPGGSVDDTLAIYDTIQFLNCDVATYCIGQAASGAAVVLASGAKNKRFILPHARVMIHQPLGGYQGQASDIEIHTREILGIREKLNQILAHHTGQDVEKVAQDTDRDNFMSANKAKEYGLIDAVLDKRPTS